MFRRRSDDDARDRAVRDARAKHATRAAEHAVQAGRDIEAAAQGVDRTVGRWESFLADFGTTRTRPPGPATPAELVAELERGLAEVDRQHEELRAIVDESERLAADWEHKAMLALRDGHEALARHALLRQEEQRLSTLPLREELARVEAVREAFRETLAAAVYRRWLAEGGNAPPSRDAPLTND